MSRLAKTFFGRGSKLFIIVFVTATIAPQILSVTPASADDGGYPWVSAVPTGSQYTWGYSTCPPSDSNCRAMTDNGYGTADPWVYGLRNCTSYAAWKINQVFGVTNISGWGNAATWYTGYTNPQTYPVYSPSNYTPQVGDIAQWNSGLGHSLGHVAYVYAVNGGIASLDEYNVAGTGNFTGENTSPRTTASTSAGTPDHYIHIGNVGLHGSLTFGNSTDTPITGGWNTIALTDIGTWRAGSFYLHHADGSYATITFGNSTDTPITGDWDSSGTTDVGTWRAGTFYRRNPDGTYSSVAFGNSTDTPITGNWDGPGATQVGTWRAGYFYLRHSDGTYSTIAFGNSTDTPITGDWDGNGVTDVGVWRAGYFYLRRADGTNTTVTFGNSTDTPIAGNWDGTGITETGVWRTGTFYFND